MDKEFIKDIFIEIQHTLKRNIWEEIKSSIWCTNFLLFIILLILLLSN